MSESARRPWRQSLAVRVTELRAETLALYLAARHPGTPWHAKLAAFWAYSAFSATSPR